MLLSSDVSPLLCETISLSQKDNIKNLLFQVETYSVEQEFDFRQFVMKFASKSVCSAYGTLFANYEHNSDFTNLCIIKMFHRIAFDCSLPALLFHFSIFRYVCNCKNCLAYKKRE
jgi:hypothetical protein